MSPAARSAQVPSQNACDDPGSSYESLSTQQLRGIAKLCSNPDVARLFYNRAYHRELLDLYRMYSGLQHYREDDGSSYESYRIFIALVEAFARDALARGDDSMLAWLNQSYDKAIEVAELRLKGYDRIANRLEREWLYP